MNPLAEPLAINVTQAPTDAPAEYVVPGTVDIEPLAAFAHYDGTGTGSSWIPAMAFYSDGGLLVARVFPQGVTLGAGATADVTFGPF